MILGIKLSLFYEIIIINITKLTNWSNSMELNDTNDIILKNFIDQVFNKYDVDKKGHLGLDEMILFFNDLFKKLNILTTVTK